MLLPVITAIVCLLSFFLMLKDMEEQHKEMETETQRDNRIPTTVWIYSGICVVLTVLIAVFFPSVYPNNSPWINVKRMVLLAILWPIAYIDFKTYRIPNKFVIFGIICRVVIFALEFLLQNPTIWTSLISEAIAAGALLLASVLCALIVKNGIGFGDMKLFIVIGLFLGTESVWGVVFVAFIAMFLIASVLLITKKKTRKDAIPFGPALVLGAYLSICLSGM